MANGADINIEDNMGNTIVSFVSKEYAKYGKERLKMVLDYGADPFFDDRRPNEECRNLLAEYRWKRLKERDKDTARRYAKNVVFGENGNLNLPKEIWEIILLHKRQQMLCQNLSSNKNKEILYLFALELGIVIPDKESMSKAKLCALISRQLTYGRELSRQDKVEKDLVRHRNVIKNLAFLYGIDPNKSLPEILSQLSGVL